MILRPLESASDFELASAWLQLKENSQWLDFGANRQGVTPALLKIMVQRQTNFIRVYTSYEDDAPLGIVALNNVDRNMRTGTLWGVAGDKSFRCRGSTQVAASRLLTVAFQELGLHSVNTWTVEHNASRRAVERLGFRFIGRQRQCHFIDGQPYDRLLFDLLASEHRELDPAGFAALRARAGAARATAQLPAHAARFACGFETSWSACGFGEQARARDRISLIEVAGRPGVRLRTLPGDREIAGSGAAERADLALSPEATGCVEGREQWWAHSLLFPSDYELPVVTAADSWAWGLVFPGHQPGPLGQANFQV